ncbi:hypothetical protein PR202_ga24105 [Eleusine coracana subsp. coracana]|uniref:Uncharacterized protein n=1 Tax=Eleusine coracana subsp. coracana TaxID=191504 RepID=A0AAV5D813_ELECO|nr:hypothetical protein PR202_ga24105 [Eleusine coracana subsp. coracana]
MEEGQGGEEARYQNSEDGSSSSNRCSGNEMISVQFMQKIIAEVLGTYFMIFAGCGSVVVNLSTNGTVTFPGICAVWGLVVMVPSYVVAQVLGSTLASLTLRLVFGGTTAHEHLFGTAPQGSEAQAVVLEFVISFYLMFVVSGVATDNRAIGELAGLAVGATVLLNVLFAGPITGASMNPARTLGPAIVAGRYKSMWVYVVGPVSGTVAGAWAYNLIRFTDKPLREITKSGSFLRSARSIRS